MNKVIPKFWIPNRFSDERRIISLAIVENKGRNLKAVYEWLQSKLTVQDGRESQGKPKSERSIEGYLRGFYAVDLFKLDGKVYSEVDYEKKVTKSCLVRISRNSKVESIDSLEELIEFNENTFKEKFVQYTAQSSNLLKTYINDVYDNFDISEYRKLSKRKQIDFLKDRCGYTEVIQEGLGSLNIFLEDKTNIDSYLSLFEFIQLNYSKLAQENFGLIPIGIVVDDLKRKSNYQEDEFKSFLMQLKYTNRIVLKTTKSQLAKSRDLELMDIHGIRYGFLKLIDSTTPEV